MNCSLRSCVSALAVFGTVLVTGSNIGAAQDWRTMTQLPGVNMAGLDPQQQASVLQILREEDCPCGCNMTLAQCRVEDQQCPMSPKLAKRVTDAARQGHSAFIIRSSLLSDLPPNQLDRQVTFEAVRTAALSEQIEEPEFKSPQGADKDFWYDFGPSVYGKRDVPKYDTLAHYPIGLQNTVETLRKYRSAEFWNPHLRQAEAIVQNQIAWLNDQQPRDRAQVAQQLHALSVRAYEIMDNAVIQFARSQGWMAKLVFKAPSAGPTVQVNVSVQPTGATVYYVSDYQFRATAKLGLRAIRDVNKNWNSYGKFPDGRARSAKMALSGKVRFYAIWPNGREEMMLVELKLRSDERPVNNVVIKAL